MQNTAVTKQARSRAMCTSRYTRWATSDVGGEMASRITRSVLRQISSRYRQIKPPEDAWCLVEAVTPACRGQAASRTNV